MKLELRPLSLEFADSIALHLNDRDVRINITDHIAHPYTRAHAVTWIEQNRKHEGPAQHLAMVRDGEAIGAAGCERIGDLGRMTGECGYWLGRAHWGQGIAARALEKNGFHRQATVVRGAFKDGQVADSWLYVRLR